MYVCMYISGYGLTLNLVRGRGSPSGYGFGLPPPTQIPLFTGTRLIGAPVSDAQTSPTLRAGFTSMPAPHVH